MMNRFNLPNIDFFEKAPESIVAEMLFYINETTGLELTRSDPRRKFVEALANFVTVERNRADFALKQNLLAYAIDNALDLKGAESNTARLPAAQAKTIIQFTLEVDRNVVLVIPAGTRFKIAETFFQTETTEIVPTGVNTYDITTVSLEAGTTANGLLAGEPVTLVDPLPYVVSVANTTTSAGGADAEDDDPFATRIHLAPERYSTAGPELAYKYFALTASQDISDVEVDNPDPGVTRIVALLKDGEIPTQQHLDAILEVCSASDVRPLTDNVIVVEPEIEQFDMEVEYWLPMSKAPFANELIDRIEAKFTDYLIWQKSKLGRNINPTEVIDRLKNIDADVKGAARVEVSTEYTEIPKNSIAVANLTSIEFKGFIDE